MNGTPPAASTSANCGPGSGLSAEEVGFTKNHSSFVVLTRLKGSESNPALTPQLNQPNQYIIRFVHGADLTAAAKDTKVAVTWIHTSSHTPKPYPADSVQQQADGSYLATITFKGKSGGTYEIHVDLTEGTTEDEHVVQVSI